MYLSEVGTSPPHDSDTPHRLVDRLTTTTTETTEPNYRFYPLNPPPYSDCQEHSKSAEKVTKSGNGKTNEYFPLYNVLI